MGKLKLLQNYCKKSTCYYGYVISALIPLVQTPTSNLPYSCSFAGGMFISSAIVCDDSEAVLYHELYFIKSH